MQMHLRGRKAMTAAAAAAASLFLVTACGGGGGGGGGSDSKTVTVWSSTDPLVFEGLKKQVVAKAKAQGITVNMQKVDNINQLIMTKIQANDTPDIALIPQPGVVGDIVKRGAAQPLDDVLDMGALQKTMTPGTLEAGTFNDKLYGLLVSMNVKSLVYYPKQAWDKAGYQVPQSLGELETLTNKIKSDGTPPWCFAIGSDAATGWPATDWFEDLIMRYGGPSGYNKWVTHQTKFDSPLVKQAANEFEKLLLTNGNTAGGRGSISSTSFGDADNPMWDNPPGCFMLKQGNFIISKDFLPSKVVANVDKNIGVYYFPPAQAGGVKPVLGGGDLATLLSDTDSAKKVMQILADPSVGEKAAPSSSFISPHKTFDQSLYPSDLTRQTANIAYKSDQFLFDGSDQMPGAVGAGTFWKDMTSWISGQESLNQALTNIDQSWPTT